MKLFITRRSSGVKATAEYNPTSKRFVVLKGSVVSKVISTAPSFRGEKTVRILRDKYVVDRVVKEDVHFESSSTAANFVTGVSTDGPRTWKNEDGITLRDILCQAKG